MGKWGCALQIFSMVTHLRSCTCFSGCSGILHFGCLYCNLVDMFDVYNENLSNIGLIYFEIGSRVGLNSMALQMSKCIEQISVLISCHGCENFTSIQL